MPDILIGNVRGPQGETGPANTLLASVYQFCASDTGATIPQDGAWTSGVPQIEKGKYIWCRNTLTWDSGPETVLYSVGYVGYDGEFNGIELVNELGQRVDALEARVTPISKGGTESTTLEGAQAKLGITALKDALAQVNDCTTGINLIRGSQNFRIGTDHIWPNYGNGQICLDGWSGNNNQVFSTYQDEEGFTVLKSVRSGASAAVAYAYSSNPIPIDPEQTYTISFDVMIDDVSAHDYSTIFNWSFMEESSDGSAARIQYLDVSKAVIGLDKAESGKWYTVVYQPKITVSYDRSKKHYLYIALCNFKNGSINFKKPMIQQGAINHPVYIANPNDVDFINDETTGINLLKGTRDFIQGTVKNSINSVIYNDGCTPNTSILREKDSDGVTYLSYKATTNTTIYLSCVGGDSIQAGQEYTYSFEFFIANGAGLSNVSIGSISFYEGSSQRQFEQLDVTAGTYTLNEWHRAVLHLKAPDNYDPNTWIMVLSLRWPTNTDIKFRRPCVYKGYINHPIWSASPYDVAQQSDMNHAMRFLGTIPANTNWSTLTETGFWRVDMQNNTGQTDYPSGCGQWGTLEVFRNNVSNSYITQRYIDTGNKIYIRNKQQNNLVGSAWAKVSTESVAVVS